MPSSTRERVTRLAEVLGLLAPTLSLAPFVPLGGAVAGIAIGLLLAIASLLAPTRDRGLAYIVVGVAAGIIASSALGWDLLALSLPVAAALSLAMLSVLRGSDTVLRTLLLLLPYHLLTILVSLSVLGAPPHKLLSAIINPRIAPSWVPGGAVRAGLGIGFFTYAYAGLGLRGSSASLSLAAGLGYAALWATLVADEGYPVGVSLAASATLLPIILVDFITSRRFRD